MSTPDDPLDSIERDLELALAVVEEVDEFTFARFRSRDFTVDWKVNQTEVTEIDREAERRIVSALTTARPDHAAFGEEHGRRGDSDAEWCWIVDPIDGTSGFVRGVPIWGTLIALTHRTHGAVLGVVSAPALGRRWWGARGHGAHVLEYGSSRRISVSAVSELGDAQVSITHNEGWDRLGKSAGLLALQGAARRSRGVGDFWQHMMVAEGAMDVAVDAVGVAPYDVAALLPIVEAAGGRLTDRHGEATYEHDTAISTNGLLHDTVLARL